MRQVLIIALVLLAGCDREAAEKGQREIDFVAACDMALESNLVSKKTAEMAVIWQYSEAKGYGFVKRDYDATNAMGGKISSTYDCAVNIATREIELLEVTGPFGKNVLILK